MALNPGALDAAGNWTNAECMARFIEDALPPSPPIDDPALAATVRKGRREFLIAVSTGIIEYLKAHDTDSFRVTSAWQVEIT